MRHAVAVLILVLLGFCGIAAVADASPSPEAKMIAKINKVRAHERGLRPLHTSPNLERSAGAFASWLIHHDSFQHRPSVSVTRSYAHAGEALAINYTLKAQVGGTLRSWLASPSHRALVLTKSMGLVGVGHASASSAGGARTIWVLQVARR